MIRELDISRLKEKAKGLPDIKMVFEKPPKDYLGESETGAAQEKSEAAVSVIREKVTEGKQAAAGILKNAAGKIKGGRSGRAKPMKEYLAKDPAEPEPLYKKASAKERLIRLWNSREAVSIMVIMIMILSVAIPAAGVSMAKTYMAEHREPATPIQDYIAADLTTILHTVATQDYVSHLEFGTAPNCRGMTEDAAKEKLEKKYDVTVERKKLTYKKLIAKSSTLFFGEVEKQEQDENEVMIQVLEPNMKDDLTAEMVAIGGRLAWPLPSSHNISSHFGHRSSPGGIGSTNHQGLDITGVTGQPIIAAKEGEVTHASVYGGYGNCVIIKHDNGYETLYGHMSSITCNVGDMVEPGDVIGKVGIHRKFTGPHLHFGIIKNGMYVDPEPLLTGNERVAAGDEVSENGTDMDDPLQDETDAEDTTAKNKKPQAGKKVKDKKDPKKPKDKDPDKEPSEPEETKPTDPEPTEPDPTEETKPDKPQPTQPTKPIPKPDETKPPEDD